MIIEIGHDLTSR